MSQQSRIVMDLRNFVSWFSLLKITQILEGMDTSAVLEIHGADVEMRQDLSRILPSSSYRISTAAAREDAEGFCQILIEKTGVPPQQADH